jgi:beta-phosphoglucomutase
MNTYSAEGIIFQPLVAMHPAAVIFDLDGVIVDTARYHFLAWKKLAEELGIKLTESFNENLKGVGRMESLEKILALGNLSLDEEEKARLAEKKNAWFNHYISSMQPDEIFPGVLPLLDELRHNRIRVALASSSKNAQTVLRRLNLTQAFEVITDGTDIVHSKPHPEIFLTTAARLGMAPASCLVIEDAAAGVTAALRAGMKVIGVGSADVLRHAHAVVPQTGKLTLPFIQRVFSQSA